MSGAENGIDIIFRLINFGTVALLGWYLFMRYMLPSVKSELAAKIKQMKQLIERHKHLIHKKELSEKGKRDDLVLQATLKEKHALWRAEVNRCHTESLVKRNAKRIALAQQLKEQIAYVEKERLMHQILPEALTQATRALQKEYAADASQDAFMQKLFVNIERKP